MEYKIIVIIMEVYEEMSETYITNYKSELYRGIIISEFSKKNLKKINIRNVIIFLHEKMKNILLIYSNQYICNIYYIYKCINQ